MTTRSKTKRTIDEVDVEDKSQEKRQLLKALKEQGFGVIYDFELLRSYLPSKSQAELKFLVDSYIKKGEKHCEEQGYIDRFPEMKNIAKWVSVVKNCVPFPTKKDDFADVLRDIFLDLDEFEPRTESPTSHDYVSDDLTSEDHDEEGSKDGNDSERVKIDYKAIHNYFNEILNNRYPGTLGENEATIALSLISNVCEMVQLLKNDDKIDAFLEAESWWMSPTAITNGDANSQNEIVGANAGQTDNINAHNDPDQPEYYEVLPRFRKIRECLNPLKVPSAILKDNHELLASFLM